MCQILEVSRSGFYAWRDRPPSKRKIENQAILKLAQKSYDECKGMCGLDKILADVRESYPLCSRQRLYNIQRENQLYAKRRKKFKATTNSKHKLPVAENLLNQDFNAGEPAVCGLLTSAIVRPDNIVSAMKHVTRTLLECMSEIS